MELLRFVPYRGLYGLSDGLAFLLYRVIGYRKKVILENLQRGFPEKTPAQIRAMLPAVYRNLTDVTLEALKSHTASLSKMNRRAPVRNPELVNQYLDRGQAVILSGAHLANWEYAGLTMPPRFHGATVCAYKPMTNRLADAYTNRMRHRAGMEMMSMADTFPIMRRRRHEAAVFILLADQSPSNRKSAHWVPFFGEETASLPGVDVLARSLKMPVLYFGVRRLRRGFYEVTLDEIWPNPTTAQAEDITSAYARHVERLIREQPESWLWSHKRWKIKR